MWKDHYLKFASYEQFYETMPQEWQQGASLTHASDVIGTLYRTDTYEPLEGFHVNLRLREDIPLPATLESFALPEPTFPKRVFA